MLALCFAFCFHDLCSLAYPLIPFSSSFWFSQALCQDTNYIPRAPTFPLMAEDLDLFLLPSLPVLPVPSPEDDPTLGKESALRVPHGTGQDSKIHVSREETVCMLPKHSVKGRTRHPRVQEGSRSN